MSKSTRLLLLALTMVTFSCKAAHLNTSTTSPVNVNPSPSSAVTAASCSVSDVQNALNQARVGYTVAIPAGTCTWTTPVRVNDAINLVGAGPGNTVVIDQVDRSNCSDHPAILMNVPANLPWRLANFSIQGSATDPGQCSEHIKIVTNSHSFRVDDVVLNNMQTTGISVNGDAWGVIDHVTMNGDQKRGILIEHTTWGGIGLWGDNSWAQADTMGTEQAVFVEDSTFNITNATSVGSVACQGGGRCVARYNTLPFLGTHGTDSSLRLRSIRHFEVYNNIITDSGSVVGQAMQLRGGTALFFNNTITPTQGGSYGGILALEIYREANGWTPWGPSSNSYLGGCDGTGPFDNNHGTTYDIGKAGAASVTDSLIDITKTWAPHQWIGYTLHNSTRSWGASVLDNTATTITTYPITHGTNVHTWNAGDSYQILKVYPCLDQPGRGAGTYISGGGNATPPIPAGWPSQAVDPIYTWNNTLNGVPTAAVGHYYSHIQANRDYYDWTASFDGSVGTGQGLFSARPVTCTPLVAYWATDTNTLYQCSATNTWTAYYSPYAYPHPLTQK